MLDNIKKPRSSKTGETVVHKASSVSFATLISRILGYVRDMLIANFFGATMAADAFFVAYRIPNLLRRLLILDPLPLIEINTHPVFGNYQPKTSPDLVMDYM